MNVQLANSALNTAKGVIMDQDACTIPSITRSAGRHEFRLNRLPALEVSASRNLLYDIHGMSIAACACDSLGHSPRELQEAI